MNTSDIDQKNNKGKAYWRSLDELDLTDEYLKWASKDEYPGGLGNESVSESVTGVSRRNFLTYMGASLALAGVSGCVRRPEEHIIPYAKGVETSLPGIPNHYATAYALGGVGLGLIVESNDGRPTKIEGNPSHPDSLGATDVFAQASVLELYDPDRLTVYTANGKEVDKLAFFAQLLEKVKSLKSVQGAKLRFLSEYSSSPTMSALKSFIASQLPQALWHTYEPVSMDFVYEGTKISFGRHLQPIYNLAKAKVVCSVESDFLSSGYGSVRHAKAFADGRRVLTESDGMNRLYSVEGRYSVTGTMADHRLKLAPSQMGLFLQALAGELAKKGVEISSDLFATNVSSVDLKFVAAVADDLSKNRGGSLIIVGEQQPASVQALAFAINIALGNLDQTISFVKPVVADWSGSNGPLSLKSLCEAANSGQVDTLVIIGGNPVFDAPSDLEFTKVLSKIPTSIALTIRETETSSLCNWKAPRSHYLESWSDIRSVGGTASVVQPLIEPLYANVSDLELVSYFLEVPSYKGYDLVKAYWQSVVGELGFEKKWRKFLHEGVVENTAYSFEPVQIDLAKVSEAIKAEKKYNAPTKDSLELYFVQDSKLYDGRFANNGWLQELPDPITKMTWDNAAIVSVKTAMELGLKNKDLVTLQAGTGTLEVPVWIVPGVADYLLVLSLGYGHLDKVAGRISKGSGFNTYVLRLSQSTNFVQGVSVSNTKKTYAIAVTQEHGRMENRPLIKEASLDGDHGYRKNPKFAKEDEHLSIESIFEEYNFTGQQWGLVVDLNSCTGCSVCTIACQAENNIPVVGKTRVIDSREMHWIRLDRYFSGTDGDDVGMHSPKIAFQPVMCQHCQNAPCEPVCPVAATVHSKDGGMNEMVYNRCVGTRYCLNNCPYKVRRFNFFSYVEGMTEVEKMAKNPDVTVRMRGVVEKCSYCVQRINRARGEAKQAGLQNIPDGAIVPACAQACPSSAITFGDINNPESQVAKLKATNRNYVILRELNAKARTSYMAKLRNPNPSLVG